MSKQSKLIWAMATQQGKQREAPNPDTLLFLTATLHFFFFLGDWGLTFFPHTKEHPLSALRHALVKACHAVYDARHPVLVERFKKLSPHPPHPPKKCFFLIIKQANRGAARRFVYTELAGGASSLTRETTTNSSNSSRVSSDSFIRWKFLIEAARMD